MSPARCGPSLAQEHPAAEGNSAHTGSAGQAPEEIAVFDGQRERGNGHPSLSGQHAEKEVAALQAMVLGAQAAAAHLDLINRRRLLIEDGLSVVTAPGESVPGHLEIDTEPAHPVLDVSGIPHQPGGAGSEVRTAVAVLRG